MERGNILRNRYQRRQLGQLSGRPSFLNLTNSVQEKDEDTTSSEKRRSNSDDWLYTVYRKQFSRFQEQLCDNRRRAKSLDWSFPNMKATAVELKNLDSSYTVDSSASQESDHYVRVVHKVDKKINN